MRLAVTVNVKAAVDPAVVGQIFTRFVFATRVPTSEESKQTHTTSWKGAVSCVLKAVDLLGKFFAPGRLSAGHDHRRWRVDPGVPRKPA